MSREIMLSVMTVTFNSRKEIEGFLKSIQPLRSRIRLELIIIDNNSRDGTQEFLSKFKASEPEATIEFNERNVGLSAAINRAIELSRGDLLLFCNPDLVFTPSFENIFEAQSKHPEFAVSPFMMNMDGTPQVGTWHRYPTTTRLLIWQTAIGWHISRIFPFIKNDFLYLNHKFAAPWDAVEQPGGSCLLLSRQTLQKITCTERFYDEKFPVWWNDVDFALRARELGITMAVYSNAQVYHSWNHSRRGITSTTAAQLFYSSRGMIGLARKWRLHPTILKLGFFIDAVALATFRTTASIIKRRRIGNKRDFMVKLLQTFRISLQ